MAGKEILMGTSNNKVKEALLGQEIIGSCDEQAVTHYLRNNFLINMNFNTHNKN